MSPLLRAAPVLATLLALTACGPAVVESAPAAGSGPVASAEPTVAPSATPASSPTKTKPKPKPKPEPSAAASEAPKPVPATLKFTAKTVGGDSFDGAQLQGDPVLLWFWAPWCPTCRSQLPDVRKLAKTYDGQVTVLGVGSLDDEAAIRRFADTATGMTQLVDPDGSVWKHFGVQEQSSFILLDRDGKQVFQSGYGDGVNLNNQLSRVA